MITGVAFQLLPCPGTVGAVNGIDPTRRFWSVMSTRVGTIRIE